jgi:hypothetical protein
MSIASRSGGINLKWRSDMPEILKDLPAGIDGVRAIGKISGEDYKSVVEPMLFDARKHGRRVRFLYEFGPDFEAFAAGGSWADTKVGLSSMRLLDGCAIVADAEWIRKASEAFAFFMPCPVEVFTLKDHDAAVKWLSTLPQGPAVAHRLLPEAGVIVVEVKEPLRSEDFDSLAVTADTWIDAHGTLNGIVLHAKSFPGWGNFESLITHIRFFRDHHRKVKRVALAADGEIASIGPALARHFVQAEINEFSYHDLDAAISWAQGGSESGKVRQQPGDEAGAAHS